MSGVDEKSMNWMMMTAGIVLAVIAGFGAVGLLIATAVEGLHLLLPSILLGGVSVGGGWCASYYGTAVTGASKVFASDIEREVLTAKQRRDLRRARGGLVLEKALLDIEHERDNITHKAITAANDPDKPPHVTSFSPDPEASISIQELKAKDRDHYGNSNRSGRDY